MAARLGSACREQRQRAGLRLIDIALEAATAESNVHNFERGHHWLRSTDELVAAYAQLCGATAKVLWQAAVDAE
jgi:hypothetical protein